MTDTLRLGSVRTWRLPLRHRFTIARSSSLERRSVFVELASDDGLVAYGEGAPNARYGETAEGCLAAIEGLRDELEVPLSERTEFLAHIRPRFASNRAALAAIDMAFHDALGRARGEALHRIWGLDPAAVPPTSMTIGIDRIDRMQERAREASAFAVLKVKLGTPEDEEIIRGLREVTETPIRVDANEGWRDREEALARIEWLAEQGVELVEQPLPAARIEDTAWLRERSPLPIFADEAFADPEDAATVRHAYDGVNIKLMKCGGLQPARACIAAAREAGLRVMLGCMVESSLGIAAAAQLAPLVDHIDLDGNLLIDDDPFVGHPVASGRLLLTDVPGLGASPGPAFAF